MRAIRRRCSVRDGCPGLAGVRAPTRAGTCHGVAPYTPEPPMHPVDLRVGTAAARRPKARTLDSHKTDRTVSGRRDRGWEVRPAHGQGQPRRYDTQPEQPPLPFLTLRTLRGRTRCAAADTGWQPQPDTGSRWEPVLPRALGPQANFLARGTQTHLETNLSHPSSWPNPMWKPCAASLVGSLTPRIQNGTEWERVTTPAMLVKGFLIGPARPRRRCSMPMLGLWTRPLARFVLRRPADQTPIIMRRYKQPAALILGWSSRLVGLSFFSSPSLDVFLPVGSPFSIVRVFHYLHPRAGPRPLRTSHKEIYTASRLHEETPLLGLDDFDSPAS